MSQTFVFEELDSATREYLTAVRDADGDGAPGIYAPTTSAMAGCGCAGGLIVIGLTLALTLTTWLDVIYKDPARNAFLQTAGLLVGGWLLVAGVRAKASVKGSKSLAGHWVYVDPLHLYEAKYEQVKVTPIEDAVEANFTHNYNNGSYQNSVVRILLDGGRSLSFTLNNDARAEQMVVYLNYLAWARGPEGKERAGLPAGSLGGLAKYVSVHDVEPKDADDGLNLDLLDTEIEGVPEEPTREGRAAPSFLPFLLIPLFGAGIFFLMKDVVNPPLRDDAIYEAVTAHSGAIEPRFLRAYLMDERNTRHRADAQDHLNRLYDNATGQLRQLDNLPADPELRKGMTDLRKGMIAVLESLKTADQPFVSMKVEEKNARAGAQDRVQKLRDDLVGNVNVREDGSVTVSPHGIMGRMAAIAPPVTVPDVVISPPPPPVGIQLIDFAEKPEEAAHAHFEVSYEFVQIGKTARYGLNVTVEVRTDLEAAPAATYTERLTGDFAEADFARQVDELRKRLLLGLVGGNQ